MVGYLGGIGIFAWLWQNERFARHRIAPFFFGFVVFATTGGYLLFGRGGNIPDGVLLSSTVLEGQSDGYVEGQSNLALFSTQTRRYNLRLERGWMDLHPISAPFKRQPEPTVVLQDGADSSRFQLPLREWDYKLFRMRFVDRFPMRAEFEQQGDQLVMKVDNRSAKDLTDCWLVVPGRRYALGDIPRGASWTKVVSIASVNGQERHAPTRADTIDLRDLPFKDKAREILFHSSVFARDEGSARWSSGAAVFFGWVKDPEQRVWIDDQRIRTHNYMLFRAIIPLAGPEDE
jgi:hypothetical protein